MRVSMTNSWGNLHLCPEGHLLYSAENLRKGQIGRYIFRIMLTCDQTVRKVICILLGVMLELQPEPCDRTGYCE